jgi:hypothetical protein
MLKLKLFVGNELFKLYLKVASDAIESKSDLGNAKKHLEHC